MLPRLSGSVLLVAALAVTAPSAADPAEDQAHWAWKKLEQPKVPVGEAQPTNPIDSFVRAKLKAAGLSPAPSASREQLIRRVTFDLTGLPPTPEEVAAFVADKSPEAWEKVIDACSPARARRAVGAALARPRPLRRHQWLQYDSRGPTPGDTAITSSELQRGQTVRRFIIEQLAGDEAFRVIPTLSRRVPYSADMTDASDQASGG